MSLDGLMSHTFPELVTEQYTADMEAKLDEIERGDDTRERWLRSWYGAFREAMARAERLGIAYRQRHGLAAARSVSSGGAGREETKIRCDRCGEANYQKIQRRQAKGSFLACPACRMTRNVKARVRAGACPKCGSALIEKKLPKRAAFWGCVRYGAETNPCSYAEGSREECEGTRPAPRARERASANGRGETREPTEKSCPKCGKHKLVVVTPAATRKRGSPAPAAFYACEDHVCNFSLPVGAKRRREPCPSCGGIVLERRRTPRPDGGGGEPFWSCARYPACTWSERWPATA
jgi:DNA topoisomerase-1